MAENNQPILESILQSQPIVESQAISQSQSIFSSDSESQNSQNPQNAKKVCEFEMIQGKRRDKVILHPKTEHQLYVRNKVLANGSVAYTCKEDNCKARIFLKDGDCFFSDPFYGHLHGNKEKEIAELKLLAQIKEKCAKPTTSQTTSQISEVREIFENAVLK